MMGKLSQRNPSWRRRNRRAVSPIIATILLVAITVVLAAVLYILVSQYTKTGASGAPLGSAYGMGASTIVAGAASVTGCTTTGEVCYSIPITSAGNNIKLSNLAFQVKTASGGIVNTWTTVTVLNIAGTTVDTYTRSSGLWTSSGTSVVSTQFTLILDTGAISGSFSTDSFIALGTGSFSGQVAITIS
jgi:flagellin-like protein